MTRDDEKRHILDDRWKSGNSEKLLRDRVLTSRGQAFGESTHDQPPKKHSLSSRLSKSNRTTSWIKNPPEPALSKKKSKDSTV